MARIARLLGAALAAIVGLFVIVVPWVWQRCVRSDPTRDRPGWGRRERRDLVGTAPTMPPPPRPPSHRSGVRRGAICLVIVGLVLWATPAGRQLVGRDRAPQEPGGFVLAPTADEVDRADGLSEVLAEPVDPDLEEFSPEGVPASLEGQDWWYDSEYVKPIEWLFTKSAWLPINPFRFPDISSKYIDVENGYRQGWKAPPCDCRRLTVWVYGGSTAWGLDQRPEHTIPSEIARIADENGLTVDVSNRGQLGHLHWMEAERFAYDVTQEDPPDVVVFYDGVNDTWSANTLNVLESGDTRRIFDPTVRDAWDASERSEGPAPDGPVASDLLGEGRGPQLGSAEFAAAVVARYDRSRMVSRSVAAANDVADTYIWQPNRFTRPIVETEPHGDARTENFARLRDQQMRAVLPDDVLDMGDVFDENTDALYSDDVHHNEVGARIVAEAIYAAIEDDLLAAAGRSSGAD